MKIKRREFITTTLAASLVGCDSASKESQTLDQFLDNSVQSGNIAGLIMLVARDGQMIYQGKKGFKDANKTMPIGYEDNFRYASLSKLFINAAILRLFDMGKLRFEQNVRDFLPDFSPKLADGTIPEITISHLLSHSAGLDYCFNINDKGGYRKAGISCGLDSSLISLQDNLRRISSMPLLYTPGDGWRYSVANDVLGAVIENIMGQNLQTAINNLINLPLGLKSPTFVAPPNSMNDAFYKNNDQLEVMENETIVTSYNESISFDTNRIYNKDAFPSGGAGMGGNAIDFLSLLEAIRNGDFIKQSTRAIAKQAIFGENPKYFEAGWGFGYLFSTLLNPKKAGLRFGKNTICWGGVYGHLWLIDFEHKLSVALLSNTVFQATSLGFKQALFSNISQNYIKPQ
jgi:CubicO group peptidase (beta-lactamase class C family)